MLADSDVKVGQHCWAELDGRLLVVLKVRDGGEYEVCDAWERGVCDDRLNIISIIERLETTKFYSYTNNNQQVEK